MAYFEMHAHPQFSVARRRSAMLLLDSLIRLLSLTSLDASVPQHWPPVHAPINTTTGESYPDYATAADRLFGCGSTSYGGCECEQYTVQKQWPSVLAIAPKWQWSMMWPMGMSEGDIQKEECRRVVWSSIMITSASNHYLSEDGDFDPSDLSIHDRHSVRLPYLPSRL